GGAKVLQPQYSCRARAGELASVRTRVKACCRARRRAGEGPHTRTVRARRVRMAAGKIAGQSTSAVARAEGVSRDWATQELGSVECRQILVSLVNGTLERMAQLFKTVLDTIEAGMKADKMVVAKEMTVNLGADHYARLTAAKRFLELVTAGPPV